MNVTARMFRWLVCFAFGCVVPTPAAEPTPPDVSRIIAVVGPRSVAHACPVGPNLAVTAGHVVQIPGLLGPPRTYSYRGESAEWSGFLDPAMASDYEDGGFLRADQPFPSWYVFALRPPLPGERLWWVGYDWSKKSRAFTRRVFSARVSHVVAGNIILDEGTPPGSSGSCVLSSDGMVIGTIAWAHGTEDQRSVAVAVGYWPPWFNGVPKP